jgi:signal peptidase II
LKRSGIIFGLTAACIVIADQVSKFLIRSNMAVGESIPRDSFVSIHHLQNTGAAFGLFDDHTSVLIGISTLGAIAVIASFFYTDKLPFLHGTGAKIVLGLVLGGIIGNLIDRIRLGYVTDFIDVGIWPTFNLADSAVVIGILSLIYLILFGASDKQATDEQGA